MVVWNAVAVDAAVSAMATASVSPMIRGFMAAPWLFSALGVIPIGRHRVSAGGLALMVAPVASTVKAQTPIVRMD